MANNLTIKWFKDLNKSDIDLAGGKGANLGELAQTDIPVPVGFVITTQAYEIFVEANQLQVQIIDLANQTRTNDPLSYEVASEKIQALFMQGAISDTLKAEIKSAYEQLTSHGEIAVAVRSSATAEDLPDASFAGQQDTYLNIQGETALLDAIKKCWASLWTGRAISYRSRQNIAPDVVSLAVIVQQLIPADSAGILFTANPTTGERDEILINATWGLGEVIVGGLVTPDSVIVDKSDWKIISRETSTKTMMTVRTDTGTHEQAVPQAQQNQQVLDDTTAIALAKYGQQIETHYGMPMDIEWGIANGEIAILQARPITSLPPAPLKDVVWEAPTPDSIWFRRQIVEHMPEPLSPLFEDLYLRSGLDQSIENLMVVMGDIANFKLDYPSLMPHGFADSINGYGYTTGSYSMNRKTYLAILKMYPRIYKFISAPGFDWDGVVLPRYQALIKHWRSINLTDTTDEELLRGIRELAAEDSNFWFGSAPMLAFSRIFDVVFDRLLRSFLVRFSLPQPRPRSATFLRGFDSKALDAQADMEAIAKTIRESATLSERVNQTSANQLLDALADHSEGHPILDSIQHYMDDYGHQIYNLDFVDPTQNEDPLPMLLSLKALVKNPPEQDARSRQRAMAEERDTLIDYTMNRLNPISRRIFRWVWNKAKKYAPYREHVMFYMGAGWPTLRTLAQELGQRLTNAGTLSNPDDIYYLNSTEITKAVEARANGQNISEYVQLTQERRDLREARKRLTPQPRVPERSVLKFGPVNLSMFDPTPDDTDNTGNTGPVLKGYAVSTGRVTAPASVIHSIKDFDQMQSGTILVCTTTTPAWTPLFSQAKGLVTDVGGALAHGSIVAREYGIPAVMGTGVATNRIKSGQMLVVDGDAGTVTLLDENNPVENEPVQAEQQANNLPKKGIVAIVIGAITALFFWRRRR